MYEYRGIVTRVIDGDTLVIDIDLGFRIRHEIVVRLAGIDTPEVVGETKAAGLAAAQFVGDWLAKQTTGSVMVRTMKNPADKFGRWMAWIAPMVLVEGVDVPAAETLNEVLLKAGHAKPYEGGRR